MILTKWQTRFWQILLFLNVFNLGWRIQAIEWDAYVLGTIISLMVCVYFLTAASAYAEGVRAGEKLAPFPPKANQR